MDPAVSVVIPVYNQEKYVGKCIRSVLSQSFQNFEVILVNDGSTDKSMMVCQRYAKRDGRISIIDKQNEGLAFARKDGFLNAKGDYICFIDSDDYLAAGALETLYKLAKESDADMTIGNFDQVFDNWGLIKKESNPFPEVDRLVIGRSEVIPFMLANNVEGYHTVSTVVWGRLYRRTCIVRALEESLYPLFPNQSGEDNCFNLAMAPFLGSVRIFDVVVSHYRYGGASTRYYAQVRKGSSLYDNCFDFCIRYGYEYLLPSPFKTYSIMLMKDVVGQIHFHVYSYEEIREFVRREFEERKMVLWAREHMDKIPEEMKKECLIHSVLNKNVEEFLAMANNHERFLQKHHYWKMRLLGIYGKIANGIARML